jgi:hypothetical protein
MSIEVYSLALLDLLALPGSGEREDLIEFIRNECWLSDVVDPLIDEEYFGADDSEREVASLADAVAQIIDGKELLGPAFVYGYAYEAMCWALGDTILSPSDEPLNLPIQSLDGSLRYWGFPLRLHDLCYAGCPLALPEPEDYPFMGWWSPEQIALGMGAVDLLRFEGEEEEVADVLRIRDWLAGASALVGHCLVGFVGD